MRHGGECSDERLLEHEALMEQAQTDLTVHKRKAQEALEHYTFITHSTVTNNVYSAFSAIVSLVSLDAQTVLGAIGVLGVLYTPSPFWISCKLTHEVTLILLM